MFALLQAGTYTIVATRYGKDIGGTEGEFELVISETSEALPSSCRRFESAAR